MKLLESLNAGAKVKTKIIGPSLLLLLLLLLYVLTDAVDSTD